MVPDLAGSARENRSDCPLGGVASTDAVLDQLGLRSSFTSVDNAASLVTPDGGDCCGTD